MNTWSERQRTTYCNCLWYVSSPDALDLEKFVQRPHRCEVGDIRVVGRDKLRCQGCASRNCLEPFRVNHFFASPSGRTGVGTLCHCEQKGALFIVWAPKGCVYVNLTRFGGRCPNCHDELVPVLDRGDALRILLCRDRCRKFVHVAPENQGVYWIGEGKCVLLSPPLPRDRYAAYANLLASAGFSGAPEPNEDGTAARLTGTFDTEPIEQIVRVEELYQRVTENQDGEHGCI